MQDLLREKLLDKKKEIEEDITFYRNQLDKENSKLDLINEMLEEEEEDTEDEEEEEEDDEQETPFDPNDVNGNLHNN